MSKKKFERTVYKIVIKKLLGHSLVRTMRTSVYNHFYNYNSSSESNQSLSDSQSDSFNVIINSSCIALSWSLWMYWFCIFCTCLHSACHNSGVISANACLIKASTLQQPSTFFAAFFGFLFTTLPNHLYRTKVIVIWR